MAVVDEIANEGSVGHKKLNGAMTVIASANTRIFKKISLKEKALPFYLHGTSKVDGIFHFSSSEVAVNNAAAVVEMLGISLRNAEGVGCAFRVKPEDLVNYTYHTFLLSAKNFAKEFFYVKLGFV